MMLPLAFSRCSESKRVRSVCMYDVCVFGGATNTYVGFLSVELKGFGSGTDKLSE